MLQNPVGWLSLVVLSAVSGCSSSGATPGSDSPVGGTGGLSGAGGASGGSASPSGGAPTFGGAGTGTQAGSGGLAGIGGMIGGTGGVAASGGAPAAAGMAGGGASGAPGAGGAAGAAGAAGTGGATGCASAGFMLCEDFEGTPAGTAAPQGWGKAGSMNIVEDEFHRGRRSLRVNTATNGFRGITRSMQALGSFGGSHWGRIFYKVQTPTPAVFVHSTMVALNGPGPLNRNVNVRVVDTVQNADRTHQFLYNVQHPSDEFGKGSRYDYRFENVWRCAEWRIDAATQNYHFYYEGTEITSIAINNGAGNFANSEIPTTFQTLSIGWNNYQVVNNGGFVAWIDDIALHTERVTCAR